MQDVNPSAACPQVVIFDVYETLLDMSGIEKRLNHLFDTSKGYAIWFELFMQYCFVANCTGVFNDFASIAKATMQMTAHKLGRMVQDTDLDAVLVNLKHLPVHTDVQEGLSKLNDMGFRIAALTNSPEDVVCERMERTGLISYFEVVLSAEQVKKYKPALEVYQWAAKKLNVPCNEVLLVSSHGWDLAGAAQSGMSTAYLQSDKELLYPLGPPPDFRCKSLTELASLLKPKEKEARF